MTSPAFVKLRLGGELARVQDNIDATLRPVAQAVLSTPLGGGPLPGWIYPDLLNSYTNAGLIGTDQFAAAAFHKDALGYVHVKGVLLNGSGGPTSATIFVLPVGYRPKEVHQIAVQGASLTIQFIKLTPDGAVTPQIAIGAGNSVAIEFSFLAEQ